MLSFDGAQGIIARELENLQIPAAPADLYDPVRYTLSSGGKRIRPALVLLSCDLFEKDYKKAIKAALGIEIFHSFTLIHDDLMDHSSMRRNNPTVHIKWNPNVAILSGDAMSFMAYQLLAGVEDHLLPPVIELFTETAIKVCEGQIMDMNFEARKNVSVNDYIRMIGLKTSVLIAASLKMGSLIAEAPLEDCEHIYNFGFDLGIAFQLQDDLLDIYGESDILGKTIGNDIVTNKKTFFMIKALELANLTERTQLDQLLSIQGLDPEKKVKAVTELYNKLNIKSLAEKLIGQYFNDALHHLDAVMVKPERKKILTDLSFSLMHRNK